MTVHARAPVQRAHLGRPQDVSLDVWQQDVYVQLTIDQFTEKLHFSERFCLFFPKNMSLKGNLI